MRTHRILIALTVVNLVVLAFALAQTARPSAQESAPVLRGRALEIVDAAGRVRASISVEPPTEVDGQAYPESLLLRLRDPNGPTVKLEASSRGTGLRLSDGSGTAGINLNARVTGISVKVTNRDGSEHILKP